MNDTFLTKDELDVVCESVYNGMNSSIFDDNLFNPCFYYFINGFNNRTIDEYEASRQALIDGGIDEPGADTSVFSSDFQYNLLDYLYTHSDDSYAIGKDYLSQNIIDKYLEKKNSSNHSGSSSVDVSQYYNDIFPNVDIVSNTFISSVTFVIGFVILILVIKKAIKYFINVIKYKGFGSGLAKQDYDMYLSDKVNEDHENKFDL